MTDIPDVNPDIRSSNRGSPAFATQAILVPGTPNPGNLSHSYQYSGGSDGAGNVQAVTGAEHQSFKVKSVADQRHHFREVDIDTNSTQISSKDLRDHEVTIDDADNQAEVDYYKIKFRGTGNGNCEFYCDSRVQNLMPSA